MAIDADPDLLHGFEARIINNFFERLYLLIHPQNFDQMQLTLAVQEERHNMANWREAHGLPNPWPPTHENLAATPPMPMPFVDQQFSPLENNFATSFGESDNNFTGLPGWTSGSSNCSPFRQAVNQNVVDDTVSPRAVVFRSSYAMNDPRSYAEDMSMFTFSDSESSMHALPQQPIPSTHRRKTGQRCGKASRSSQSHNFQQGRHLLPDGPGQAVPRTQPEGFETYDHPLGRGLDQQSYSTGAQLDDPRRELTLTSNGPTSAYADKHLSPSCRQTTSLQVQTHAFGGLLNGVSTISSQASTSSTQASPNFPPGQNMPGFVPIGRIGIATAAQGNTWPIERNLIEQLVGAERGHGEYRLKVRLTYKEILAKYSRWEIKESTLRGIKRKITLPKEHRERRPRWDAEHINSLRLHVPTYTDRKGKIAWAKVVDAIKRDTGRPFGAGTTSKKWSDISKTQTTRRCTVTDQQNQSGGEEADIDETESPSSIVETTDASEEDLPSHQFSFHGDDNDDDRLVGMGGFAPINSFKSRMPYSQVWH